tara:strand:+ start:6 stop:1361 length:1356 start_codon:yes stop_codon:yes gene_type:complete
MSDTTTGRLNSSFGALAMAFNTTGTQNCVFGNEALYESRVSNDNVAIGYKALNKLNDGSSTNTAVGSFALSFLGQNQSFSIAVVNAAASGYTMSGTDRSASGQPANGNNPNITLNIGDTATFNISAIGHPFWIQTSSGGYNSSNVLGTDDGVTNNGQENGAVTFVPTTAGTYYYICQYHVAMQGTITVNGSTTPNTALGYAALYQNTVGGNNVAVGKNVMFENISGNNNTSIGHQSHYGSSASTHSSSDCVSVGHMAHYSLDTGNQNTSVGKWAGYFVNTGSNNTLLGYQAGTGSSPSGSVNSNSNVICLGDNSVQNIYCNDTSISSSDLRDKTDIQNFDHGLAWIKELRPVTYRWDKRSWYTEDPGTKGTPDGSKKTNRIHVGFIAQEAIEVEKKFGYGDTKDNMLITNQDEDDADPSYGMKYERLIPVLVNAIKELSSEIDTLKAKIAE